MSVILKGLELEIAREWMNVTLEKARESLCKRDQRGVVVIKDGIKIGSGVNSPPCGFMCEPKYCEPTCKDYAVHAEMNALAEAVKLGKGLDLIGATMYHARADENGDLAVSRKPKCYNCSKHIVTFGIRDFVLNHEEGLTLYTVEEFNRLSLENSRK